MGSTQARRDSPLTMRVTETHARARLELPHSPHAQRPSRHFNPFTVVVNIMMPGYAGHSSDPEGGELVSLGVSWADSYPNRY